MTIICPEQEETTAVYIRLSVAKDSQDRDSIENQKSIMQAALEKKSNIALQQFMGMYIREPDHKKGKIDVRLNHQRKEDTLRTPPCSDKEARRCKC